MIKQCTSRLILDLFLRQTLFLAVDQRARWESPGWAVGQTSSPPGAATFVSQPLGRRCHFRWHLPSGLHFLTKVNLYAFLFLIGLLLQRPSENLEGTNSGLEKSSLRR